MPSIRIIMIPAGETPEHVRQAWAGLTIPLQRGRSGRRQVFPVFDVLSGPKSLAGRWSRLLTGRYLRYDGYAVPALQALEVLDVDNPAAAAWQRANAPHLIKPECRLVFEAAACEEIP